MDVVFSAGDDSGSAGEDLLAIEFEESASFELAEGYTVSWKLVEATDAATQSRRLKNEETSQEVIFKLQKDTTGWMGFGIEPADASVSGMQDTDMYIGWVGDDGTVELMDTWAMGELTGSDKRQCWT